MRRDFTGETYQIASGGGYNGLAFEQERIILSDTDRAILDSYGNLIDGLAEYLGEGFEMVLHSMESLDRSVIKIVNGHHTGRKVGAPITNLALSLYNEITGDEGNNAFITYRAVNNKGEPLYSTTILIRGEYGRVIGMLCINFFMNTPLANIFKLFDMANLSTHVSSLNEKFFENVDEMLNAAIDQASKEIDADASILPSNRNREIICLLYSRGLFSVKDAVPKVADYMGLSKNTIYLHLRYARQCDE